MMRFKANDRVKVVGNRCGHSFDIGEIVTIREIVYSKYECNDSWYNAVNDNGVRWAVYDDDVELVVDTIIPLQLIEFSSKIIRELMSTKEGKKILFKVLDELMDTDERKEYLYQALIDKMFGGIK